jgi:hypothetical protein
MFRRLLSALLLLAPLTGAAPRDSARAAADLRIEAAWANATSAGARVGAGYLRIRNAGRTAERLLAASLTGTGRVELHEMRVTDGVMRMRPTRGGFAIPPGATLELRPGGRHLMFLDLAAPLVAGQPAAGTLVFARAGTLPVRYEVLPMGERPGRAAER